jgi:hypothetical protein
MFIKKTHTQKNQLKFSVKFRSQPDKTRRNVELLIVRTYERGFSLYISSGPGVSREGPLNL